MASIQPFKPESGVDIVSYPSTQADGAESQRRSARSTHDASADMGHGSLPGAAGLDSYLAQELRPEPLIAGALTPGRFAVLLEQALDDLGSAVQNNPEAATVLNRAARVLGDEMDLRGLMNMYRSALLQG